MRKGSSDARRDAATLQGRWAMQALQAPQLLLSKVDDVDQNDAAIVAEWRALEPQRRRHESGTADPVCSVLRRPRGGCKTSTRALLLNLETSGCAHCPRLCCAEVAEANQQVAASGLVELPLVFVCRPAAWSVSTERAEPLHNFGSMECILLHLRPTYVSNATLLVQPEPPTQPLYHLGEVAATGSTDPWHHHAAAVVAVS